jgi:hypothetical protein
LFRRFPSFLRAALILLEFLPVKGIFFSSS